MKSILIYTSGDKNHGLGHVKRELVLAEEFLSCGVRVGFETPPNTVGYRLIEEWCADRKYVIVNDASRGHDAIIIDVEHGPSRTLLEEARRKFHRVIIVGGVGFRINDQQAIDRLVDLQVYQSIAINDVSDSVTNNLIGCEYLIIHKDYQSLRDVYGSTITGRDILVTMGGGDPHELTGVVCEAAKICCNGNGMGVRAVIGAAFDKTFSRRMLLPSGVKCSFAPPTLLNDFANSRCVVNALGMTTYEAACVGVPTASIGWSEDHVETARKLEEVNVTVNLGLWNKPDWEKMKDFVERMNDENEWQKMNRAGKRLVDGLGVKRVADKIQEIL